MNWLKVLDPVMYTTVSSSGKYTEDKEIRSFFFYFLRHFTKNEISYYSMLNLTKTQFVLI